jgi:D-glycerate 3-kinase
MVCTFSRRERPVLVGLCGAQGSGKSTTVRRLLKRLEFMGLRPVACSLDDFYLTKHERQMLSATVHPLLATRGVPGTHDVALMERVVSELLNGEKEAETSIPVFDKLLDDRLPRTEWLHHAGETDIVIVEGWCLGARPQPERLLREPVNALERDEDQKGSWRAYVNAQLANAYAAFFSKFDLMVMLRPPSFDCVFRWRAEQEAGLSVKAPRDGSVMSPDQLARFIAHYERISRWIILDQRADLIVDLDEARSPMRISSARAYPALSSQYSQKISDG